MKHVNRYDSFDAKYETLKYTKPKECHNCPLAHEGICQKVYKVKITTDLRKYTAPARGSKAWETIFKQRTSVEREIGRASCRERVRAKVGGGAANERTAEERVKVTTVYM